MRLERGLAAAVALLALGLLALGVGTADAAMIRYAWYGQIEPFGIAGPHPWGIEGDGSELTPSDGTFFPLQVFVDEHALDDSPLPSGARFQPQSATLFIDGVRARMTALELELADDPLTPGDYDSITLHGDAELFGASRAFSANVQLGTATFALSSQMAADLPPLFADTLPIEFDATPGADFITFPDLDAVTSQLVPWSAFPAATVVEWTSATGGSAAGIDVTASGFGGGSPAFVDLDGPFFAAAPQFSFISGLVYEATSTWTVSFSEPVATLLLYVNGWRGAEPGGDPASYHFDAIFKIRSGLAESEIFGNSGGLILRVPAAVSQDGVLQVRGPLTSLTVTPDTTFGFQALAMAVVPMPQPRAVDWATPATGTAGTVGVALQGLEDSSVVDSFELTGLDFAVAPLPASTELVQFDTASDWTATFSEPVGGLLLYAKFWRGNSAQVDPVTYRFDAPFTILSGLDQATVSDGGTVLSVPGSEFHDGILYFGGPLTSLGIDTNSASSSSHAMTFAVVPEAGGTAGTLASLAALLLLRRGTRPERYPLTMSEPKIPRLRAFSRNDAS